MWTSIQVPVWQKRIWSRCRGARSKISRKSRRFLRFLLSLMNSLETSFWFETKSGVFAEQTTHLFVGCKWDDDSIGIGNQDEQWKKGPWLFRVYRGWICREWDRGSFPKASLIYLPAYLWERWGSHLSNFLGICQQKKMADLGGVNVGILILVKLKCGNVQNVFKKRVHHICSKKKWWWCQRLFFENFTLKLGKMIQFDEHIVSKELFHHQLLKQCDFILHFWLWSDLLDTDTSQTLTL